MCDLQAETSLYADIERLSSAWDALDRQLSTKATDLSTLEERLSRAVTEVCEYPGTMFAFSNIENVRRKQNRITSSLPQ